MQLLYILGLFSIYMRLTLSWSAFRRNSEILQHERNRGECPEFLICQFPFSDMAGREIDSCVHTAPAPCHLQSAEVAEPRDSRALDSGFLSYDL